MSGTFLRSYVYPVAKAAYSLDHLTRRAKLCAEPLDMHVHRAGLNIRCRFPDRLEQQCAREHSTLTLRQGEKKFVFRGGEINYGIINPYFVRSTIYLHRPDTEYIRPHVLGRAHAAKYRTYAQRQFLRREWFGEIVVRAQRQPANTVGFLTARSRSKTSNPDIPGSMRSRTTSDGSSAVALASASGPLLAVETPYPARARWYATSATISGSSSTTRIRSAGLPVCSPDIMIVQKVHPIAPRAGAPDCHNPVPDDSARPPAKWVTYCDVGTYLSGTTGSDGSAACSEFAAFRHCTVARGMHPGQGRQPSNRGYDRCPRPHNGLGLLR